MKEVKTISELIKIVAIISRKCGRHNWKQSSVSPDVYFWSHDGNEFNPLFPVVYCQLSLLNKAYPKKDRHLRVIEF